NIDEAYVARISIGQAVNLQFDALPGVMLPGNVTRIGQTGDRSGSIITYVVRVAINPTGEPLLPSMTTTATIINGSAKDVVRIPNRYITVENSLKKPYAIVQQQDGSDKTVEITLGLRDDAMSEVKSGLKAGDIVVAPGSANVSPSTVHVDVGS